MQICLYIEWELVLNSKRVQFKVFWHPLEDFISFVIKCYRPDPDPQKKIEKWFLRATIHFFINDCYVILTIYLIYRSKPDKKHHQTQNLDNIWHLGPWYWQKSYWRLLAKNNEAATLNKGLNFYQCLLKHLTLGTINA